MPLASARSRTVRSRKLWGRVTLASGRVCSRTTTGQRAVATLPAASSAMTRTAGCGGRIRGDRVESDPAGRGVRVREAAEEGVADRDSVARGGLGNRIGHGPGSAPVDVGEARGDPDPAASSGRWPGGSRARWRFPRSRRATTSRLPRPARWRLRRRSPALRGRSGAGRARAVPSGPPPVARLPANCSSTRTLSPSACCTVTWISRSPAPSSVSSSSTSRPEAPTTSEVGAAISGADPSARTQASPPSPATRINTTKPSQPLVVTIFPLPVSLAKPARSVRAPAH